MCLLISNIIFPIHALNLADGYIVSHLTHLRSYGSVLAVRFRRRDSVWEWGHRTDWSVERGQGDLATLCQAAIAGKGALLGVEILILSSPVRSMAASHHGTMFASQIVHNCRQPEADSCTTNENLIKLPTDNSDCACVRGPCGPKPRERRKEKGGPKGHLIGAYCTSTS